MRTEHTSKQDTMGTEDTSKQEPINTNRVMKDRLIDFNNKFFLFLNKYKGPFYTKSEMNKHQAEGNGGK